jgi:hypothetical protein
MKKNIRNHSAPFTCFFVLVERKAPPETDKKKNVFLETGEIISRGDCSEILAINRYPEMLCVLLFFSSSFRKVANESVGITQFSCYIHKKLQLK